MFASLLVLLIAHSASYSAEVVTTNFGRVHVAGENVDAAMAEGRAAHAKAKEVLALSDVYIDIVDPEYTSSQWGDLSSNNTPIYVWPFSKNSNNGNEPPPAYLLRHEIGHDLFIRYLIPSTKRNQYGGDAPDWLDEMAATAFEGEPLQAVRRRVAARYGKAAKLIPLQKFFAMNHPELTSGAIPESSGRTVPAFEATSEETGAYYATAFAFYEFLVDRTNNKAVIAEIAAAFRNGVPLERWIITRVEKENKHENLAALNSEFLTWIASDERYDVGSQIN